MISLLYFGFGFHLVLKVLKVGSFLFLGLACQVNITKKGWTLFCRIFTLGEYPTQSTQKIKIYLPLVVAFTLNSSNIKPINNHGFLLEI
jgi:hypothetical protein